MKTSTKLLFAAGAIAGGINIHNNIEIGEVNRTVNDTLNGLTVEHIKETLLSTRIGQVMQANAEGRPCSALVDGMECK